MEYGSHSTQNTSLIQLRCPKRINIPLSQPKSPTALLALLALMVLAMAPNTSHAQCINYSNYIHWNATVEIEGVYTGSIEDVILSENHAYLACGDSGLQVVDISDPDNPELVFTATTPGLAMGLALEPPYLYVADGHGLVILDISTPSAPQQVGFVAMPGAVLAVAIGSGGSMAIVVGGYPQFQRVNVIDPTNPILMQNSITIPTVAYDVWLDGTTAYLADDMFGLTVVDFSTSNPFIRSFLDLDGGGYSIFVRNNFAWVTGQDVMAVVDISNPTIPALSNSVWLPGRGVDISYLRSINPNGYFAFVATNNSSMVVFDVEDENDPQLMCSLSVPEGSNCITTEDNMFNWNYIFVGGQDRTLYSFDKGNLTHPSTVGHLDFTSTVPDVEVLGSFAFCGGGGGLYVIDVSDAEAPQLENTFPGCGIPVDFQLAYPHLYVADFYDGLLIFDVHIPGYPVLIGNVNDPSTTSSDVTVAGDYAYVVDSTETPGLHIYGISDPANVEVLGVYLNNETPWSEVDVVGSHAFVTGYGLRVIDVSNPNSPYLASVIGTAWLSKGLDVDGNFAYIAYEDAYGPGGFFKIFDISDPYPPEEVASVRLPTAARVVEVVGDMAFVSTAIDIHLFDVSTPAAPRPVGTVPTPRDHFSKMCITDSHLYIANGSADLQIMPIQCGLGVSAVEGTPPVSASSLKAYPNPFNPRTTFSYELQAGSKVELTVYDLTGRLVRTLVTAEQHTAGSFQATWFGDDNSGRAVASGVYVARLVTENHRATTRIALVR